MGHVAIYGAISIKFSRYSATCGSTDINPTRPLVLYCFSEALSFVSFEGRIIYATSSLPKSKFAVLHNLDLPIWLSILILKTGC
ncbi:hypothetical protein HanXRQr2_Chr02g0054991 [Helianthus annuus]|uniref:Uncharacterized protein n=1 Tax=Helianthus annuus TaxID=4232 RepID=A0A251UGR4_HELAN|nr:hypothetical protein HanXRQr2_Chr02g0054991 [Helianthus annuus]